MTSKILPWDEKILKKELPSIVASVKAQYTKYRIDSAGERAGCTVLRPPPCHCELNQIELMWAQIK